MALITRVSKLFKADIHAVLDRIEEPEVLLRQAIRDMEDELAQEQQRCNLMRQEQHQVDTRKVELVQSLDAFEAELDICFESAKETLARTLIKRKLETQRQLKTITRKSIAIESALSALSTGIQGNRARLDAMRQKVELITENNPPHHVEERWDTGEPTIADADVEIAFLREQQKRVQS